MSQNNIKPRESNNAASIAGRWWESYLVRYFVGTLIGSVIVAALALELAPMLKSILMTKGASPDKAAESLERLAASPAAAIIWIIAGLAFCYVSSAPITVFHATRMYRRFPNVLARYFWWLWSLTVLVDLVILFPFGHGATKAGGLLWLLAAPAIWVWFMQYMCVLRMHVDSTKLWQLARYLLRTLKIDRWTTSLAKRENEQCKLAGSRFFTDFYVRLSLARQAEHASGIRESYTHLREHSNSIFIAVIEISLASLLLLLIGSFKSRVGAADTFIYIALFLSSWLLPNVLLWSQANHLERFLIENPNRFKA